MMVLFFHAARLALVVFDPYLSSRALADGSLRSPAGELIVDDQYYTFSSVFFYSNRTALLLNGRVNNLEYGSYAPGAPKYSSTTPRSRTCGSARSGITYSQRDLRCPGWSGWWASGIYIQLSRAGGSYYSVTTDRLIRRRSVRQTSAPVESVESEEWAPVSACLSHTYSNTAGG